MITITFQFADIIVIAVFLFLTAMFGAINLREIIRRRKEKK